MLGPRYVVVPFTSIYSLPSLVGKQNESRFNNCQCPISYLISHNLPLQGPSASAYITYAREEVCALFRCHWQVSNVQKAPSPTASVFSVLRTVAILQLYGLLSKLCLWPTC